MRPLPSPPSCTVVGFSFDVFVSTKWPQSEASGVLASRLLACCLLGQYLHQALTKVKHGPSVVKMLGRLRVADSWLGCDGLGWARPGWVRLATCCTADGRTQQLYGVRDLLRRNSLYKITYCSAGRSTRHVADIVNNHCPLTDALS